jgi:hypothetical protein
VKVDEDQRVYLSIPAIREGVYAEFSVWFKPCYDFSQAFGDVPTEPDDGATENASDDFVQG